MAENRISYLDRNYDDYRKSLTSLTRKYYSDLFNNLNDASIGQWFIELVSDVGDNLSYNIDRAYQETSLESANEPETIRNLARNNGLRIPGKKSAIVEVEIYCNLPVNPQGSAATGVVGDADERYAPIVRRGTVFTTGTQLFELMSDVDFSDQFDENGVSNRQIYPIRNSNDLIVGYQYRKLAIAAAGFSKVYTKVVYENDIKPFMSILITDANILGIESIIVKEGTNLTVTPLTEEFFGDDEQYLSSDGRSTLERFFEVDNLCEQYRFGYETQRDALGIYNPKWEIAEVFDVKDEDGEVIESVPLRYVAKGKWKRLKNKFVTEFTADGSLKVTFGAGIKNVYGQIPDDSKEYTQYLMTRMEANDYMGVLPQPGSTIYILYRVGGGEDSNIAEDSLTYVASRRADVSGNCEDPQDDLKKRNVLESIGVTNPSPSYGGKDEPSDEEIKQLIKYNSAAQNRCVTLHDYYARIMEIPAKFGCPFRCGVIEENNKIVVYTLGLDYNGNLMSMLSEQVAENIKNYLSNYRMLNDFVEIRSGKIINLAFEVEIYVDKTYDNGEVVKRVIDRIYDYMDIRRHQLGEDVYIGDLEKEISKLDGLQNLVEMRIYNRSGIMDGYSKDEITQELLMSSTCGEEVGEEGRIDMNISDKMLFAEADSMFEIKYKSKDIVVTVKQRR